MCLTPSVQKSTSLAFTFCKIVTFSLHFFCYRDSNLRRIFLYATLMPYFLLPWYVKNFEPHTVHTVWINTCNILNFIPWFLALETFLSACVELTWVCRSPVNTNWLLVKTVWYLWSVLLQMWCVLGEKSNALKIVQSVRQMFPKIQHFLIYWFFFLLFKTSF